MARAVARSDRRGSPFQSFARSQAAARCPVQLLSARARRASMLFRRVCEALPSTLCSAASAPPP
eukprot:8228250-Alexandrium_andersonii.AAC.1